MSDKASLMRGSIGGWVAAFYCLVFGTIEVGSARYAFFGNSVTATLAVAFGGVSVMLLYLQWRAANSGLLSEKTSFIEMFTRNFCVVFALVLLVLSLTRGLQPELGQIIRLVFQLALVWIVYSSVRFLSRPQKD